MFINRLTSFALLFSASLCLASVSPAAAHDEDEASSIGSKNRVISFSDQAVEPAVVKLPPSDSVIFFYNNTSDALVTLSVDFGEKRAHCASSNMATGSAGVINSSTPYGPKEFATMCFHDTGSYPFTVYGLPKYPKGYRGTIVVE
jgi:hypothetical protein